MAFSHPSPMPAVTSSGLLTAKLAPETSYQKVPVSVPAEPLHASYYILPHLGPLCAMATESKRLGESGRTGAVVPPRGWEGPAHPNALPGEQLTDPSGLLLCRLSWHSLYRPGSSEPLQQRVSTAAGKPSLESKRKVSGPQFIQPQTELGPLSS